MNEERLKELERRVAEIEEIVKELAPVRMTLEEAHQERVEQRKRGRADA